MRNMKSYDEFQKKSPLMKEIDMLYGDKLNSLWIFEDTDSIYLDQIIIKPQFRNEGIGSDIMNILVTRADREGKIVGVTPVDEFGSSISRLKKFYKSFGFKPNSGRNKNFKYRDTFLREPK